MWKRLGCPKIRPVCIAGMLTRMGKGEVLALRYLRMEISTKVSGTRISPMERVNSGISAATIMKDFGPMEKLRVKAFTSQAMAQHI